MMKIKILAAVISLLLLFPLPVFAEDRVPDLEMKTANLTVSFTYTQENGTETGIEGAAFAIYKVANLAAEGGSAEWQTLEPYRQFAVYDGNRENTYNGLDTEASISLARQMAQIDNGNPYGTGITGKDGEAAFTIQPQDFGMYLVVQTGNAAGYTNTEPFLVSVPEAGGDPPAWNYQVTVSPKKAAAKITPVPAKVPARKDKSSESDISTGDRLLTRDLVMAFCGFSGMILIIIFAGKNRKEEA